MDLTPEQRDRIQHLLEEELRAAYRSARERGAEAADIQRDIAGRRRALDELLLGLAYDAQDPVDGSPGDGRIGEQRG